MASTLQSVADVQCQLVKWVDRFRHDRDSENVILSECHGRYLAEPWVAPSDLPRFDYSAMDGYAVRTEDVRHASVDRPIRLTVIGVIAAGATGEARVHPGTCYRIFTGAAIPAESDAVVMQEDVAITGEDLIEIREPCRPWEFVRLRGEEIKRGKMIFAAGVRLNATRLSLMAAFGQAEVRVVKPPRVHVIATGNELREPGVELSPGEIYESNLVGLTRLLEAAGARVVCSHFRDELSLIQDGLRDAWKASDFVITVGGASVGDHDLVRRAFTTMGGTIEAWRLNMKPGKPFFFGTAKSLGESSLLLGLPGNPVSAWVTTVLLVLPTLRRWFGASETMPRMPRVVLGETLVNPDPRPHWVRVKIGDDGCFYSAGLQASHGMLSLAEADGLVEVPGHGQLSAGSGVSLLRWDS